MQVREFVEFALRQGDLGGARDFVGRNRALAGTRGHQRLQRSRPAGYQKEVRLTQEVDAGEFVLRIQGRIDGLLVSAQEVLIEEIKTVQGGWDRWLTRCIGPKPSSTASFTRRLTPWGRSRSS